MKSLRRKTTVLFGSLLIALAVGLASAAAAAIQPVGQAIGADKQGHAVYQITANGTAIGYKLVGSGEPLVMIPGLGNTMESWPPEIVEALSKKYQLIMPDNRGMGFSKANDVAFSYKLFAADVIGLLDALKVEKTHVLGYSMGSTITQELLLEYSQRFNKAIIHAASTDGSNVAAALKGKAPSDPTAMQKIDPATQQTILRDLEATTHWKTPLDKLPLIGNQVMLVVGTADNVVGTESSKTIAAAIPGAWLVQFKKATHHLMHETPNEFAKIVLTFLDVNETVEAK